MFSCGKIIKEFNKYTMGVRKSPKKNGLIISRESKLKNENKKLKLRVKELEKQLNIGGVGISAIAEPYLISEKENQIEEMKKMGLFTEGILYEQSVNGLIQIIKDLKKI